MLELEQALERILAAIPEPQMESVPIDLAPGRVLAGAIRSPIDLPRFSNSAMDGYAVRSSDVAPATEHRPVLLRLVGRIAAGEACDVEVTGQTCVRVFTGSPLPPGADAVIMQEDTRVLPDDPAAVAACSPAEPGENIRVQGEDVRRGTVVAEPGRRVSSPLLWLLAGLGLSELPVGRRPSVSLLATGSELKEPGESLGPGQIYESNRMGLASLIVRAGGIPHVLPIVPDDERSTRQALARALESSDIVLTSGGVSVGELDYVKPAFEAIGGRLDFWRVAVKPGRPFVHGRAGDKFLFGLPGNPVSALVTFLLLVRPALLRWQGAEETALTSHPGVLLEPLSNPDGRRHFVRVRVDAEGRVASAGLQASHALGSLGASNGLVDLPPGAAWAAGQQVRVLRWE